MERNHEKAAEWFQKAAEQGHGMAQFYLGVCFEWGEGVEKDYKKAAKWFIKAAEQDVVEAQFNIAMFYKFGRGVKKKSGKFYEMVNQSSRTG